MIIILVAAVSLILVLSVWGLISWITFHMDIVFEYGQKEGGYLKYPGVIQMKNIKPEKRVCCICNKPMIGCGYFYMPTVAKGQYLHYKP